MRTELNDDLESDSESVSDFDPNKDGSDEMEVEGKKKQRVIRQDLEEEKENN